MPVGPTAKMAVLLQARRSSLVRLRTVGINQLRALFGSYLPRKKLWGARAAG